MIATSILQTASLCYREGTSDKVYHASIEPEATGFVVNFSYGRRGSTLATGTKTASPVSEKEATKIFEKLVSSKLAKGYQYSAASAGETKPYRQTGEEGNDTGIYCQLLNAVEESELNQLLCDNRHVLQEKHDGRRLLVRKHHHEIIGINRRGRVVAIPDAIRAAVALIPGDCLIDGEAVGDTLHAFDLLEVNGQDLRQRRYLDRHSGLVLLLPPNQPALRWVSTTIDANDKLEMFENLRLNKREGAVFKDKDAPFSAGRPYSGGTQLKFKFVETASFIVTGQNAKRSVALGLYDSDKLVSAGNVTIPSNHAIPINGTVVECRYLYAHRESGAIFQPVYLGPRTDIPATDCTTDQLKYKAEQVA